MNISTGQIINSRYRVVTLLSKGGFGAVYRAWDLNLNSPCALKQNFDTSPEASQQFQREASLLANLRHPNLPKVIDHFIIPGQGQFLVMEYIAGHDLQELIDQARGPLPESQVLPLIQQVLDALMYLHSQSPPVVHRDIKPANVRITPEGQAVLVDFGIAKQAEASERTMSGARATTPGYAPVEQYGHGSTDVRTDVYALGATLYAALTGKAPPESITRASGIPFPAPRQLNPVVSPQTEAAILRAMQLSPAQRFQSAAEMKVALSPAAVEPALLVAAPAMAARAKATPAAPVAAPAVSSRRRSPALKWALAGAGLLALLVVCVVAVGTGASSLGGLWLGNPTDQAIKATQNTLQQTQDALIVQKGIQATMAARQVTAPSTAPVVTSPPLASQTVVPALSSSSTPQTATPGSALQLTDWQLTHFTEVNSGCVLDDAPCWRLVDQWSSGQDVLDAVMTLNSPVYIDPAWKNPRLVFWSKPELYSSAYIEANPGPRWGKAARLLEESLRMENGDDRFDQVQGGRDFCASDSLLRLWHRPMPVVAPGFPDLARVNFLK